jgi:hypothetical protein
VRMRTCWWKIICGTTRSGRWFLYSTKKGLKTSTRIVTCSNMPNSKISLLTKSCWVYSSCQDTTTRIC